jgi:hypothetical protein
MALLDDAVQNQQAAMQGQVDTAKTAAGLWEQGLESNLLNKQALGESVGLAMGYKLGNKKHTPNPGDQPTPGGNKTPFKATVYGDTSSDDHGSIIGSIGKKLFGGILGSTLFPSDTSS